MRNFTIFQILSDITMLMASWVLVFYLRFHTFIEAPRGIPEADLYLKMLPFIAGIWTLVFIFSGHYRRSRKRRSSIREGLDIILVCALATLAFISFTYFYEEYRYSRLQTVLFSFVHPCLLIAGRSLVRKAIRNYSRRLPPINSLIIAPPEDAPNLIGIASRSILWQSHRVVGVIHPPGSVGSPDSKYQTLEEPTNWVNFLQEHNLHQVLISTSSASGRFLDEVVPIIAEQIPTVKLIPALGNVAHLAPNAEMVDGNPVISLYDSPLSGGAIIMKRTIDIMGALLSLMILSPIMLLICGLIRISSPGSVLYRQERIGQDGRNFQCLKFRSMPVGIENKSGAIWAKKSDNRATTIGKLLRRTSLDELPQLINVLKGEMSLVGPRPERPIFVAEFRKKVPGYMLRHKVKAGITGWAQVNGWRGNTSIEKRIECDLFYVQNWSMWLDFKILLKTLREVTIGKNAY